MSLFTSLTTFTNLTTFNSGDFPSFSPKKIVSPSRNPSEWKTLEASLASAKKKDDQKTDKESRGVVPCFSNFPEPPPVLLPQKHLTWPILKPDGTTLALIQIQLEKSQNKESISLNQIRLIYQYINEIINAANHPPDCERPFFNLVDNQPKFFSKTHAFLDVEKKILQIYIKDEKLPDESSHKIYKAISITIPLSGGQPKVKRCYRIINKIDLAVIPEWQLIKIQTIISSLKISEVYDYAFYEGKDNQHKCVIYGKI